MASDFYLRKREDLVECYASFTSCKLYQPNMTLPTSTIVSNALKLACDSKSAGKISLLPFS